MQRLSRLLSSGCIGRSNVETVSYDWNTFIKIIRWFKNASSSSGISKRKIDANITRRSEEILSWSSIY